MKNVDFKIFSQDIRDCFDEVFDRRYDAVFIAVDNMDIRKWIWTKLRANLDLCKYLIDVRIGGLYINVFSIKMDNASAIRVYEDELWVDKEVKELPCTGTAIIDVTLTAVGEAVGRFRQAMNNDLRAIWTFHACDFGGSTVFAHYHIREKENEKDKTDDFVRGVGKETTPEKEL